MTAPIDDAELKVVGKSGQISLGNVMPAGRYVSSGSTTDASCSRLSGWFPRANCGPSRRPTVPALNEDLLGRRRRDRRRRTSILFISLHPDHDSAYQP